MVYMDGYYKDYENRSSLICANILEKLYEGNQVKETVFPMIIDTQTCFKRDVKATEFCWGIKSFLFKKIWKEIDDRVSMGEDHAHILCCLLEANSVFLMKEHGYHPIIPSGFKFFKFSPDFANIVGISGLTILIILILRKHLIISKT